MSDNGKIVVNAEFLEQVSTQLTAVLDGYPGLFESIQALQKGQGDVDTLKHLLVKAGTEDYLKGKSFTAAVDTAGVTLSGRLESYSVTVGNLLYGILTFLEDQESVEDLNTVTSADLLEYVDYGITRG